MDETMGPAADSLNRQALEARWMELTRVLLPAMAGAAHWPIRLDHCFQRVFLDHAYGGRWTDRHRARPAYRTIADDRLAVAVGLAEQVLSGAADLPALNARSLRWRGKD